MSGGIIGVGGLAKSVVGFSVGLIGAQFLVTSTWETFTHSCGGYGIAFLLFLGCLCGYPKRWAANDVF